jgi:hypothetical protein
LRLAGPFPCGIRLFSAGSRRHYVRAGSSEILPFIAALALETSNFSAFCEEFPMKKPVPHDKYFLRSLHQEIDLYDRKLAYLEKYVQFPSTADREGAESKLLAKRASLAETARQLVAEGVEFSPADLPRSFRAAEAASADR